MENDYMALEATRRKSSYVFIDGENIDVVCREVDRWYAVDTRMISSKASFFLQLAKEAALNNYMILFLTKVGLSPSQAGSINGLRFIGSIIAAPLWGLLADYKRAHRLVALTICMGAFMLMTSQPFVGFAVNPQNGCKFVGENSSSQSNNESDSVLQSNSRAIVNYRIHNNSDINIQPRTSIENEPRTLAENKPKESVDTLFKVMMAINFIGTSFDGSTMGMVDSGVIQKINSIQSPPKVSFGRQRLFGALGFGLSSILTSIIVEYHPLPHLPCYASAFLTYGVLVLCLTLSTSFLLKDLSFVSKNEGRRSISLNNDSTRNDNFMKELRQTTCRVDILFFFATAFVAGGFHSIFMGYLFLLLNEINCPNVVMGLSVAAGSFSSLFTLRFLEKIIRLCRGTENVLVICCLSFAVRFVCVSSMENPWFTLLYQILLNGVSIALFLGTSITHVKLNSSEVVYSTMCGIFNGIFYGAGAVVSNIVAGIIVSAYGVRNLFFFSGIFGFTWTVIMILYLAICKLRKYGMRNSLYSTLP